MKHSLSLFEFGPGYNQMIPQGIIINSNGRGHDTATPATLKKWAEDFRKSQGDHEKLNWFKINLGNPGSKPYWQSSGFKLKSGKIARLEIHQDGYGK